MLALRILVAGSVLLACGPDESGETTSAGSGGSTSCAPGETPLESGCVAAGTQPNGCAAGESFFEGVGCLPAGTPESGCAAGELAQSDGSCVPAGVPACATGFMADGDGGCVPVLPAQPCAPGALGLLGETSCRAIAPCGSGTFGDIPMGGTMLYVDASAGGGGDGSMAQPFRTIQAAIDLATTGTTVAIAAGSYNEALVLSGKSLVLWGTCPSQVDVLGLAIGAGADGSEIRELGFRGAGVTVAGSEQVLIDGVWIHDTDGAGLAAQDAPPRSTALTVRASLVENAIEYGVFAAGVVDTLIEDVVVRGTQPSSAGHGWGLTLQIDEATLKQANATVRRAIVDGNAEVGLMVHGAIVEVEGTLVRDTQPNAQNRFGRGFVIQTVASLHPPADVTANGVVVEGARDAGILVAASQAVIENSVVRDVLPNLDVGDRGNGIGAQPDPMTGARPTVVVRQSLVERASENGMFFGGADLRLEGVWVRDSQPIDDGSYGRGISIQYGPGSDPTSTGEIRGCRVERSHDGGIFISSSIVDIDSTLVSDTRVSEIDDDRGIGIVVQDDLVQPIAADLKLHASIVEKSHGHGIFVSGAHADITHTLVRDVAPAFGSLSNTGRGVNIQDDYNTGVDSDAQLSGVLIEHVREVGVMIAGARAALEGVLVRDVSPADDQTAGRGINAQTDPMSGKRANVEVRWSHVEHVYDLGIFLTGGDMVVEGTLVRDVKPQPFDGLFGDGAVATQQGDGTSMTLSGVRIENVARAGIAMFGAHGSLRGTRLACNPLDLVGNDFLGIEVTLENLGGNACGCEQTAECKMMSPTLEAPPPVP